MSMRDKLKKSAAADRQKAKKARKGPKRKSAKDPSGSPDDAPAPKLPAKRSGKPKKIKKASKLERAAAQEFAHGTVAALRTTLKRKKEGDPTTISLLDDPGILSEVTEWIPTGFLAIDQILGGGWPVGRCVELSGAEGSGKSALTHMAIKQCQDMGGIVVFIDCETALDPDKLRQLGINGKALIYSNPRTLEDVWDTIYAVLERLKQFPPNVPTLIVWDSIPAATPKALLDGTAGDKHVALRARSLSENCPKVSRALADLRACLIWVNQERTKIGGGGYGPQFDTAGGRAIKYFSSLRVRCARVSTLKRKKGDKDIRTGYAIKVTTQKNRLYPPHRSTSWVLDFIKGPSPDLTMIDHLKHAGALKSSGAGLTLKYEGESIKLSKDEWSERYHGDKAFRRFTDEKYDQKVLSGLRLGTIFEDAEETDDSEAHDHDDEE